MVSLEKCSGRADVRYAPIAYHRYLHLSCYPRCVAEVTFTGVLRSRASPSTITTSKKADAKECPKQAYAAFLSELLTQGCRVRQF